MGQRTKLAPHKPRREKTNHAGIALHSRHCTSALRSASATSTMACGTATAPHTHFRTPPCLQLQVVRNSFSRRTALHSRPARRTRPPRQPTNRLGTAANNLPRTRQHKQILHRTNRPTAFSRALRDLRNSTRHRKGLRTKRVRCKNRRHQDPPNQAGTEHCNHGRTAPLTAGALPPAKHLPLRLGTRLATPPRKRLEIAQRSCGKTQKTQPPQTRNSPAWPAQLQQIVRRRGRCVLPSARRGP